MNATALGSPPLSMDNGSTGDNSVPPFCLCASRRTDLTGTFQGKVGAERTAELCFSTPPSEPDVQLSRKVGAERTASG